MPLLGMFNIVMLAMGLFELALIAGCLILLIVGVLHTKHYANSPENSLVLKFPLPLWRARRRRAGRVLPSSSDE
jgi:hypothetical protein